MFGQVVLSSDTMPDEVMDAAEAAEELGVRPETVKRWARAGQVPGAFTTPSGYWKFKRSGIDSMKAGGQQAVAQ